jgi:hypothetical protein
VRAGASLEQDHRALRTLFAAYVAGSEAASHEKAELVGRIREGLQAHGARSPLPDELPEDRVLRTLVAELEGMDARFEEFDAKVRELERAFEKHVEAERRALARPERPAPRSRRRGRA